MEKEKSDIVKKYPLITYFMLAYIMTWTIAGLAIVLELSITENPLLFLIGSCGPIFSAVIVTGITIGRSGIRELLSGWLNWRFNFKWYLATLSPLVLGFITVGIYHLLGGQSLEAGSNPTVSFILLTLLFAFLVGPLGEETGWRGFALPRLQTRFSAFTSTLILGIIWSAWHIPLWFVPDSPQTEVPFGAFIIMCVSFSFILTWAYNNSKGSILIAVLLHWCFNFTGSLIMPLGLIPPDIYFYTVAALYLVYAIVVIVVFGPTKLSRKHDFEMPFVREK